MSVALFRKPLNASPSLKADSPESPRSAANSLPQLLMRVQHLAAVAPDLVPVVDSTVTRLLALHGQTRDP